MINDTLFGVYNRYYFAIIYNEPTAILDILSSDRIKRIKTTTEQQNKYSFDDFVCKFIENQRTDYMSIPYQTHDMHCLSLLEVSDNDGALSIKVAYGDADISKPIYFVKEDGKYKLSIFHPFTSSQRYRIRNAHNEEHTVKCRGGSSQTVSAYQDLYITGEDDCGYFWSGTWFEDTGTGRRVQCQYNKSGWDVRINESGVIECRKNC